MDCAFHLWLFRMIKYLIKKLESCQIENPENGHPQKGTEQAATMKLLQYYFARVSHSDLERPEKIV